MNTHAEEQSQPHEERAHEAPRGETRYVRSKPERARHESAEELSARRAAEARRFVEVYLKTHKDLDSLIEQLEAEINRLETYLRTKATAQIREDLKMASAKLECAKRRQTQTPEAAGTLYERTWTPDRLAQRGENRAREAQRTADAALIALQHEAELTEMRLREAKHKLDQAKERGVWFFPRFLLKRQVQRIEDRQREIEMLMRVGRARQAADQRETDESSAS